MPSDSITCPKCKTEIPLSDAISHQVEERLRTEFEAEKARLVHEQAQRLADKEAEAEATLAKALEDAAAVAEARATDQVSVQMRDLETQVDEQDKLRRDAEERELQLRRENRELEKQDKSRQLEMERQLDEERTKIASQAAEQADEKWQLRVREKELRIEQMNKRIEDLQAAADQKRSGLQGEVLEREIEDLLHEAFPTDSIEPVKSGKRGADVLQRVRSSRGDCGKLLWESKNHKHWSAAWIDKLRSDQQAEKADLAIIVTSAMPDGVEHIAFVRGVWVCDFASVVPLATALREQLDAIKQTRTIDTNRARVADDVYEYLCSQEAQHHITNIVEAAMTMLHDLNAERTASERMFNKREKQLQMQIRNLAGYHGSLQAVASGALQPVAALELPAPSSDESPPLALAS
jgi:hypothetical protein